MRLCDLTNDQRAEAKQRVPEERLGEVWILVSTAILDIPDPNPGADQIGTYARAFSSREAACDALREFVRVDLNEARPDGAWDEDPDWTIDDALDLIFESNDDLNGNGDGCWSFSGSVRSYEWRLMRLEVRQ